MKMLTSADLVLKRANIPERFLKTCAKCKISTRLAIKHKLKPS